MNSIYSIIIPAYNAERTIEHAILSVKKQTYPHWELLIVENGSTDNTTDIINKYVSNNIKLFHSEKGVSIARNVGLEQAKGDYVVFLDADDELPSNTLEDYQKAQIEENIDLIFGRYSYELIDNSIKKICNKEKYICECLNNPTSKLTVVGIAYNLQSILKNNIKFSEQLTHAEDSYFVLRCLLDSQIIYDISCSTYIGHYYDGTAVRRTNIYQFDRYIPSIREIIELNGFTEKERLEINAFILNQVLVVLVNNVFTKNEYSYIELLKAEKELLEKDIVRNAIQNITYHYTDKKRTIMFKLMKYRCYNLIALACRIKNMSNLSK